jgi:hypothetical protein
MRTLLLVLTLCAAACSGTPAAPVLPSADAGAEADAGAVDAGPVSPPVTTANPPGEQNIGSIVVTLTASRPATIAYTTDGTDPSVSATAKTGASPISVPLTAPAQVTLRFFAKDASGSAETPHGETYTLLVPTTPASITGTVITHELLRTPQAQVLVAVFNSDPLVGNPKPVGATTLSPSSPGGATYKFEGLAAGRYWVAADWWPGNLTGNPEVYGLALKNPIDLDPSVTARQRVDFADVYLGECDPKGTGVDGVVQVGAGLLQDIVGVAAYTQDLTLANLNLHTPTPLVSFAAGSGSQRPFALCNPPPGTLNVIAAATPPMAKDPTDIIAASSNPISVTELTHLTLFLESPSPDFAAVSGHVTLDGPLGNGSVAIALTTEPWSNNAHFVALATVETGSQTSYPYSITGLAPGTYYLTALARDDAGTLAVTALNTSFTLTAFGAAIEDLSVNVGRVTGAIAVSGVPSSASAVQVIVGDVNTKAIVGVAAATLGPADGSGIRRANYDTFGLPDGSYGVIAVFQLPGDASFTDAFNKGHVAPAQPAPVPTADIKNGSVSVVDFSRMFP